jgi:hypothetical protein
MNLPNGWTITNEGPEGFQLSIKHWERKEILVTVRKTGAHGFAGSVVSPGQGMPVGLEFHGDGGAVAKHPLTAILDGTILCDADACCLRARGKIEYANGRVKRVLYAECDSGHQQGEEATERRGSRGR